MKSHGNASTHFCTLRWWQRYIYNKSYNMWYICSILAIIRALWTRSVITGTKEMTSHAHWLLSVCVGLIPNRSPIVAVSSIHSAALIFINGAWCFHNDHHELYICMGICVCIAEIYHTTTKRSLSVFKYVYYLQWYTENAHYNI